MSVIGAARRPRSRYGSPVEVAVAVREADASEALKGIVDVYSPDVRQLATDLLAGELRGIHLEQQSHHGARSALNVLIVGHDRAANRCARRVSRADTSSAPRLLPRARGFVPSVPYVIDAAMSERFLTRLESPYRSLALCASAGWAVRVSHSRRRIASADGAMRSGLHARVRARCESVEARRVSLTRGTEEARVALRDQAAGLVARADGQLLASNASGGPHDFDSHSASPEGDRLDLRHQRSVVQRRADKDGPA